MTTLRTQERPALLTALSPLERIFVGLTLLSITISLPLHVVLTAMENSRKAQREAEIQLDKTYDDLDVRYTDFLRLILGKGRLDAFDEPHPNPPILSEEEREEQTVLYTILISLMERTFLTFQRDSPARRHQWHGWDKYADKYIQRASFRETWSKVGGEFDSRFQVYMEEKLKVRAAALAVPPATPGTVAPPVPGEDHKGGPH